MTNFVQVFIDKAAKYKSTLLSAIRESIGTSLNHNFPKLRNIIKSIHLNRFVDLSYENILVLYAKLDNILKNRSAVHVDVKAKINNMKTRVTYLENLINYYAPKNTITFPVTFKKFTNTIKRDFITLSYSEYSKVTPELIMKDKNNKYRITHETQPTLNDMKCKPEFGDLASALLETGSTSNYLERTIYSDVPLIHLDTSGAAFNGIMHTVKLYFRTTTGINSMYLDMLPGFYRIDSVLFYILDPYKLSMSTKEYRIDSNIKENATLLFDDLGGVNGVKIKIHVPAPTIAKMEVNVDISTVENILENFNRFYINNNALQNQINKIQVSPTNDYKYAYIFGIYSMRLERIIYKNYGKVRSSAITLGVQNDYAISLNTYQDVPDNTSIEYLLSTDLGAYKIIPSYANGTRVTSYSIINSAETQHIPILGSPTESVSNNITTYSNADEYIKLSDIGKTIIETYDASIPYVTLPCEPSNITYIKHGNTTLQKVTGISDLAESAPSYYQMGNVIVLNKTYANGIYEIKYTRNPKYLKVEAILQTNSTYRTPKIYDIYFDVLYLGKAERSQTSYKGKKDAYL